MLSFFFFKAYFYCTYELSCILWMVYLPVYDVFYVHSINHSNDGCGNDNAAKRVLLLVKKQSDGEK